MVQSISYYSGIPFIILLLLIAIMPLAFPQFWEKNRYKALITAVVSLPIFIVLIFNFRLELFRSISDYASFIILLGSLFVVSGGIHLSGDLRATPAVNTLFLGLGAVIANIIGTTGASMLLIRPLLRTNRERKLTSHIPVFFIFLVSNIGGCLTPLGDPPLFLGFLHGVPFSWTFRLWPQWLLAVGLILIIFYFWDSRAYHRESIRNIVRDESAVVPLKLYGWVNFIFIIGIVLAIFLQFPAPFREITMIIMAGLSLIFTSRQTRYYNRFTFYPISEVAILFVGIFITVTPVLMILQSKGTSFGVTRPWQFFWWTGGLSSFLDNTPTYLTFFSLGESVTRSLAAGGSAVVAGVNADILKAISCAAVFMGANTYIGNGPNFMVKSIAEEQKVKVPHFFHYMAYSILILMPIFIITTLIFFRG